MHRVVHVLRELQSLGGGLARLAVELQQAVALCLDRIEGCEALGIRKWRALQ